MLQVRKEGCIAITRFARQEETGLRCVFTGTNAHFHTPCTHVNTGEPGAVRAGSPPSVPQMEEETRFESAPSKARSFTQQYLWLSLPDLSALVCAHGGPSLGVRKVARFLPSFAPCRIAVPRLPATCRRCAGVLCVSLASLGLLSLPWLPATTESSSSTRASRDWAWWASRTSGESCQVILAFVPSNNGYFLSGMPL